MNGIILVNKNKGMTSRDVVNMVSKRLNIKKVGHTGTLDPLATGLMVLCANEGCKLVELLTNHDKDYIAKVQLGISTDTYDITGKILEEKNDYQLKQEELEKTLHSFIGEYEQTVPIYSSIKINGKKLYEYARDGKEVNLPSRKVKIENLKLLEYRQNTFTFFVTVSSGTYIRSLINDISKKLNIPMTMVELKRTRVGNFKLTDASGIDNLKIIPLIDALNIKKIVVDNPILLKKVSNGVSIKNIYHEEMVMFVKDNKVISLYQETGKGMMKSYRKFNE